MAGRRPVRGEAASRVRAETRRIRRHSMRVAVFVAEGTTSGQVGKVNEAPPANAVGVDDQATRRRTAAAEGLARRVLPHAA